MQKRTEKGGPGRHAEETYPAASTGLRADAARHREETCPACAWLLEDTFPLSFQEGDNKRTPLGRGSCRLFWGDFRSAGFQPASGQDGRAPRRGEVVGLDGEAEPGQDGDCRDIGDDLIGGIISIWRAGGSLILPNGANPRTARYRPPSGSDHVHTERRAEMYSGSDRLYTGSRPWPCAGVH